VTGLVFLLPVKQGLSLFYRQQVRAGVGGL